MNLNKVSIAGRVVRDPETKTLANSGSTITSFSVVTNHFYTANKEKREESEFHNCVAFGKLADTIATYIKKGQLILVEGRLKTNSWEKDGKKHYKTDIIVEAMQMGPKPAGAQAKPGVEQGAKKQDTQDAANAF